MDTAAAFKPGAATIAISAPTVTPAAGVQLAGPNAGDVAVLVYNPGPNLVWFAYGNTAAGAQANAVAPVPGTPQPAQACGPGSYQTFTFAAGTYFAALAVTATQLIYITPGQGV
jgi:hypothetical protein